MNTEKRILTAMEEASAGSAQRFFTFRQISEFLPRGIESKAISKALNFLKSQGKLYENSASYSLPSSMELVLCKMIKLTAKFGFAGILDEDGNLTDKEIFIPGRNLLGAMKNDLTLVKVIYPADENNRSETGKIVQICQSDDGEFSGIVTQDRGNFYVVPDQLGGCPLFIQRSATMGCKEGDKITGKIVYRGANHASHNVAVTKVFGTGTLAKNCCAALIEAGGVTTEFPEECKKFAHDVSQYVITEDDLKNRIDLRNEKIFTIDSADTKDIDDAINIKKTKAGWNLSVHIADVSNFVTPKSPLDVEAYDRGCSIYYANKVVPMLPKELSNGICSLNPNEDRLAFSCFMELSPEGDLLKYEFKKSVIRSAIKGVYSEINAILKGEETEEIAQKYAPLAEQVENIQILASILFESRKKRGALDLESTESKLILDENEVCVDIKPRTRGVSEEAIEEFMLLANQSAAAFAKNYPSPFLYRVHEEPPVQKIDALGQLLRLLGFALTKDNQGEDNSSLTNPHVLAKILKQSKEKDLAQIVNVNILRSMAKAKYSEKPLGHFGLVLEDYAHFTSPIRRYPDLCIHRILNDMISKTPPEQLAKKYDTFVVNAAKQSTDREMEAMRAERRCEDFYKAEYMINHIGKEFCGKISGVTSFGVYVELENTCEGLVRLAALPDGQYDFSDMMLKNQNTGISYKIGDPLKVLVTAADVSAGNVDFVLA